MVLGSSSGPDLSLELLTASIVNAVLTQDMSTLSLLATTPLGMSSFSLPGTSLSVASSNAQLPASIGTGKPILVSPLVNMFALQLVHTKLCFIFSLRSSSPSPLPSLQQLFITAELGFLLVPYKNVSQMVKQGIRLPMS